MHAENVPYSPVQRQKLESIKFLSVGTKLGEELACRGRTSQELSDHLTPTRRLFPQCLWWFGNGQEDADPAPSVHAQPGATLGRVLVPALIGEEMNE